MAIVAKVHDLDTGYKFRVIRGFPNEGTLFYDMEFVDGAQIEFGDPVKVDATGKIDKASTAAETIGFAFGDTISPNNLASGKITVLLGAFVAITTKFNQTQSYAPGDALTIKDGQLDKPADGDPVVGRVLAVDPANGTLTFVFKGVD